MAQPKIKKKTRSSVRFVKTPEARARKRKRSPSRAAVRPSVVRRRRRAVAEGGLPNWADLEAGDGKSSRAPEWSGAFATVPILRLVVVILSIAAVFTVYVGHVHATTDLLTEVDRLRSENLELHLDRNLVKGSFDRASGPGVIATRARALGLVEVVPTGSPVTISTN